MKFYLRCIGVTLVLLGAGLVYCKFQYTSGGYPSVVDVNQKHPKDKRDFRALTLANDLSVLLISDPEMNKSAGAMDVAVGSIENPKEHLGLAHFLEHMLFMGTKKYPEVDEYQDYVSRYQGTTNAYTTSYDTNYMFELNHDGLEGALDRFAQFFIAPTFDPHFLDRERLAVDSEHQKNIKDDNWREMQVMTSLYKDGHPKQLFSTGDRETLANANQETILEFYKKHYSANLMKLVLMSNRSLDELEQLAKTYFSEIPNTNKLPPHSDPEIFAKEDLPRLISVKPVKDIKKLTLIFPTESAYSYYKSKPDHIISHLIGYEGKGSLLAALKEEGLVLGLGADLDSNPDFGTFQFEFTLTEKGVNQKDRILEMFFAYVDVLRKSGYQRYFFDERKVMADLDFVYRDQKEGMGVASQYARRMQIFKPLEVDRNDRLIFEYSPQDFDKFLSFIRPENLNAVFVANTVKTDRVEPHYGAEYSVTKFDPAQIKKWQDPSNSLALHVPDPNPFIPKNLDVMTSKTPTAPKKLIDEPGIVFWFQQDDRFYLPKADVSFMLVSNKINQSPKEKALSALYKMALDEGLNEWHYDIYLAGLDYTVSRQDRGILIEFSGYSENIPTLLEELSKRLTSIVIDSSRLNALKDELKRFIANSSYEAAYRQALYQLKYLLAPDSIHKLDVYDPDRGVDLISKITLEELQKFALELYSEVGLEGSSFGSLDEQALKDSVLKVLNNVGAKPLSRDKWPPVNTIHLDKSYAQVATSKSNNSAWLSHLQFGAREPKLEAAILLGHAHLKSNFFTELRSKQQLGYVVSSLPYFDENAVGLAFVIQSADYPSFELANRVEAWYVQALTNLREMKDEEYKAYQEEVVKDLREKDRAISQVHKRNYFEAISLRGQFDYSESVAKAALAWEKSDVVSVFAEAFGSPQKRALSIYLLNANGQKQKTVEVEITDALDFKRKMAHF